MDPKYYVATFWIKSLTQDDVPAASGIEHYRTEVCDQHPLTVLLGYQQANENARMAGSPSCQPVLFALVFYTEITKDEYDQHQCFIIPMIHG